MPGLKRVELSRREILLSGIALAATGIGGQGRAFAEANLTVGDHEITVFSDGHLALPMGFVLPEQSAEEISALLTPHGMATNMLTPDCNITLLRSGDRLVLFDVGSGQNFQPSAGELLSKLEDAGIDPSDITDVILTHAHPDHLWGILDEFDDPLYPQANIHVPQGEWDFWRADDTLANMPDERKSFVVGAQSRLEAIEDQVSMITPGDEVLPGVEAVGTHGHTPGHMSYMIHGGSQSIFVVGDAISNAVISFEKPEWASGTDQDRDQGIATRKMLLDRLALDQSRIIGFHFPHPGEGQVEKATQGYRFVTG
ncbi:MBL fold metallo-hydrolase [Roseibium marinum]|uniref:Glyoxylase-like metal-dependent hydrolase (Beta-lactamase superfamily II) n=1 Tax=Roseibium marinum TaxID=281252 RepID=A0A2S3V117_9HYPH|nr:MBL fold metallo-hydrolase [Roseibium marinum]POF33671.1 glyoxylase-like metal-dependent hydrolase (beta-lactamase superfamily II) [Roseibium marinum]